MLSAITRIRVVLSVLCITLLGCADHKMERAFFRESLDDRLERLRQYSLEDQYRIFRYGNDVVHPPLTNLAIPIAERGAVAIPFLKAHLDTDDEDFSVRDILRIIREMTQLKTYDAKNDKSLMRALTLRVSKVMDKDWQAICATMLEDIKSG
jgi:hypothetical protein